MLSPERMIDRLVAQPIFADLDPVSLRVIALASELRQHDYGDVIFEEGRLSDGAFFILSGEVQLEGNDGSLETARDGDLLHPLALLTALERPFTAIALAPSEILKIPRSVFLRIMSSAPSIALRLRDKLTRDLMRSRQGLREAEKALNPTP